MARPLPLIPDLPSTDPQLGFVEYIEALADAIATTHPPQFTVGIYGAWGTGKSSLLLGLRERFKTDNPDVVPVLFDAWRYERAEYVVIPILHAIATEVETAGDAKLISAIQRAIKAVLFSLTFKLGPVQTSGAEVHQNWIAPTLTQLDEAFAKPFTEMRNISAHLRDRRIVLLIDDLDRCSPAHVVALLETIRLVMDVPGIVFVLAIDYDVMVAAVQHKYPHASGEKFLEKIVQVPFRVPPLHIARNQFFEQLIPRWKGVQTVLPRGFEELARSVSISALEGNPRQIKRLLNAFMLISSIVTTRGGKVDYKLLTPIIGLQLRWPGAYSALQRAATMNVGAQSEEEAPESIIPATVLADADDDELNRYGEAFFSKALAVTKLRETIELTTAVLPMERGSLAHTGARRVVCFRCRASNPRGATYCGECGELITCPRCGALIPDPSWDECASCGLDLGGARGGAGRTGGLA